MPRKTETITAVPVEQPTEPISTEPLTDAQEMNNIANELKPNPEDQSASAIEAPSEPVVLKPKRGSRTKKPLNKRSQRTRGKA